MKYDRKIISNAYNTRDESGEFVAAIGPRDYDRFRQTLRLIPRDVRTLLDCGCGVGYWLNYVGEKLNLSRLIGVDVAAEKIDEGIKLYPGLDLSAGFL